MEICLERKTYEIPNKNNVEVGDVSLYMVFKGELIPFKIGRVWSRTISSVNLMERRGLIVTNKPYEDSVIVKKNKTLLIGENCLKYLKKYETFLNPEANQPLTKEFRALKEYFYWIRGKDY